MTAAQVRRPIRWRRWVGVGLIVLGAVVLVVWGPMVFLLGYWDGWPVIAAAFMSAAMGAWMVRSA